MSFRTTISLTLFLSFLDPYIFNSGNNPTALSGKKTKKQKTLLKLIENEQSRRYQVLKTETQAVTGPLIRETLTLLHESLAECKQERRGEKKKKKN